MAVGETEVKLHGYWRYGGGSEDGGGKGRQWERIDSGGGETSMEEDDEKGHDRQREGK